MDQELISRVMRELGARGGRKKVPKGLAKMDPERRREIAKMGVLARWGNRKKPG